MRRSSGVCAVMMLVAVSGCGGGADAPQPVSGKVTIKGGGPLEKGTIRFTNPAKKVSATGTVDATGSYQLSSLGANDGALVGDYTVTLSGTESGGGYNPSGETAPAKKPIDDKYDADSTTDLKYTVKPGKNVANFELDPAK